jgi:Na+/glutamate symporter
MNKIKFARMILFPTRIDDLPFPAFQQMNIGQKIIKVCSLVALPVLSALSLCALAFWLIRRKWAYVLWMCLPLGLVLVHSYIGFVEQRYLATSYPFFLMLSAGFIAAMSERSITSLRQQGE